MVLTITAAALAVLSFVLTLWQWLAARRFPLHQRVPSPFHALPVTLLKPLKGRDAETELCLRSWFEQDYRGPVHLLFGVASSEDPVCELVRKLIAAYPKVDAQLVICAQQLGANAKVSTLTQLEPHARHDLIVISDADVRVPSDLLANVVEPLRDTGVGLVNCLYQLAHPRTLAMRWEAVAVNADFWSHVLQAQSMKPLDFALGAVMATTRARLQSIGGFAELLEYLADDYQLGHKIARQGGRIVLCPVVAECWSEPMGWGAVWTHQLRWARTIRVCQPVPFFFSVLANGAFWPVLWLVTSPVLPTAGVVSAFLVVRILTALDNQRRLTGLRIWWPDAWLVLMKDLAGVLVWALAFIGNRIHWRGNWYRMRPDGRLEAAD